MWNRSLCGGKRQFSCILGQLIEVSTAQPEEVQELLSKLVQDMKIISDELSEYINTPAWNRPLVYCDDDDDEDYTIAITPVLSTEEPVNSLIMEDEHLDTIPVTESDEFIKSSVEILDDILLIKDDTLREKLLNVNRLVAKIEALKDNPVPSSVVVTKSTSTFPNLFLEETNTFDNSLPESETFCFNLEEPSSGSPTTPSDLSLPDYEAFSNDHIEETNRFYFKIEPELGNLTMDVVGNIFQESEPRVHVLNVLPTLELDFIPSSESIFAYVVWIFLPFLFIPVIPPYLLSCDCPGCPDCEDSQFVIHSRVFTSSLHLESDILI
ncbi:hypothetical protein Tco_1133705 [Tanacetum coccineum]